MPAMKTLAAPLDRRRAKSPVPKRRPGRAVPLEISLDSRWLGRRFSAAEYERMIDAGIIKDGEPLELLDGRLVPKMSKKPGHRISTHRTADVLRGLLPKGWYVDTQEPVLLRELHLGAGNVPEPDVSVVRGSTDEYSANHPTADTIALVVEVSDSTLRDDRGLKKQIYAHARIPEYWIINLIDQQLEVYQRPTGSALKADYEVTRTYALTDSVSVRVGNKVIGPIPVRELFPKK